MAASEAAADAALLPRRRLFGAASSLMSWTLAVELDCAEMAPVRAEGKHLRRAAARRSPRRRQFRLRWEFGPSAR